jgi:hypothetical protein
VLTCSLGFVLAVLVTAANRIYREFCVWGGTMLLREPSHAVTQTACHPG